MNKIAFLLIAVLAMAFTQAQNINDGLRYATDNTNGSARFQAMAGAFGALGGDVSSMAINPAGTSIFLFNKADITFSVDDIENSSTYFGTSRTSGDSRVDVVQGGGVFVFDSYNDESPWRKFTIGLNYNRTQDLDNELFIQGTGNTSISQFFLEQAQGVPLDLLETRIGESVGELYQFLGETRGTGAQNALLGFQGFIINPVENNAGNIQYTSAIAPGQFNQQYSYLTRGYTGKYTLNFSTQYGEKLFLGVNLNSHVIDYEQRTVLFETNSNTGSTTDAVFFENNLGVLGSGFSAQVGGIAKVSEEFRIGFTYDTPTWYNISEETIQYLESDRTVNGATLTTIIDPRVVNVFADYDLRTPGKLGASAAYIFGGNGLLSFDYSYKDYSNIKFRPSGDPAFAATNTNIENSLKGASTFRVGGEARIDNVSLRAGYRFEESPYENETTVGDLTGYSAGIGYNFGEVNLDLSYTRTSQDRNQQLYNVGLTDSAQIEQVNNTVLLTLGISL